MGDRLAEQVQIVEALVVDWVFELEAHQALTQVNWIFCLLSVCQESCLFLTVLVIKRRPQVEPLYLDSAACSSDARVTGTSIRLERTNIPWWHFRRKDTKAVAHAAGLSNRQLRRLLLVLRRLQQSVYRRHAELTLLCVQLKFLGALLLHFHTHQG